MFFFVDVCQSFHSFFVHLLVWGFDSFCLYLGYLSNQWINLTNEKSKQIHTHVTFDGEDSVEDRFSWHPLKRELVLIEASVGIMSVDVGCRSKVRQLQPMAIAHKNTATCKVAMNDSFRREVLLHGLNSSTVQNLFENKKKMHREL